MKNKLSTSLLLLVICIAINSICIAKTTEFNSLFNTDITVGSKTSDSTGVVSISNSQLQQSIMSEIPILSGRTILNTPPVILVSHGSSYLIFQVGAPSGAIFNVALRLSLMSNSFSFKPKGNKNVQICKANGDCHSCVFIKDNLKDIIGCSING